MELTAHLLVSKPLNQNAMERIFAIFMLLFSVVPLIGADSTDVAYADHLFTRINANIEAGTYENNLAAYPIFSKETSFQKLPCQEKAKIFHRIGVSFYLSDREAEAITCFRDSALTYWTNCAEAIETDKANTIFNIGICYQYLGMEEQAKKYLDEALLIFEHADDYPPLKLAEKYFGVAAFYKDQYNFFRAELYYQNALNIYEKIPGSELDQFYILNDFQIMSIDSRKYDQAKGYFDQALQIYEKAKSDIADYDLSLLYQNAGIAYFESGNIDSAMMMSRQALQLIDAENDPMLFANGLEKMAMINGQAKQFDLAIEGLQQVVKLRKQSLANTTDYLDLAYAYENLSEIYWKKGNLNQANRWLQKAMTTLLIQGAYDQDSLPIIRQSIPIRRLDLIRMLDIKNQLLKSSDGQTPNVATLTKVMDVHAKIDSLINQQLLNFQFEKAQLNFIEAIQSYYGKAVADALHLYHLSQHDQYLELAYFYSSKTKAILLQTHQRDAAAFEAVATTSLAQKERALIQQLSDLQNQLSVPSPQKDSLLRAYTAAQQELERFLTSIEQSNPIYFQQKYAFITPPSLEAIQQSIAHNMAIVEYVVTPQNLYSFWITTNAVKVHTLPYQESLINELHSYINQCQNPDLPIDRSLGQKLYEKLLFNGLRDLPPDLNHLRIIPDGLLHRLSFEALAVDRPQGPWLVQSFNIAYAYSIGLFLSGQKSPIYKWPYMGFGTQYSPTINQKLKQQKLLIGTENLVPLSLAPQEIQRGAAIFNGKSFLDQAAKRDTFLKYGAQARILHFSLHGLVDYEDPLRSCLLFDDQRPIFYSFCC